MAITHRPTAGPDEPDCLDHLTVPISGATLALVEGPDGPVIVFDRNDPALTKGHMTLAEAGAWSAALAELRTKAAAR